MTLSTYTADELVEDYTHDATGVASQFFELYRPDGDGPYPVLVFLPDLLADYDGALDSARDGLAYLARANGLAVAKASYRQLTDTPAGIFSACEEDGVQVVQRLRQLASTYRIDPDQIVLYGIRRGANVAAWSSLGPDQATGSGQEAQSSRVRASILEGVVARWQTMTQASTSASDFSTDSADTLSDIATATQDAASPLLFGDDARNADQPTFLIHDQPAELADPADPPYPDDTLEELGSSWHGDALLRMLERQDATFHGDWSRRRDLSLDRTVLELVVEEALDWLLWVVGRLPVEELVLRAIEDKVRTVTHANGYTTDVQEVFRWEDSEHVSRVYPCAMATSLRTDYDDPQSHGKLTGRLRVGLTLLDRGLPRSSTRASIFIADVRKAMDDNDYWELRATAARLGIGQPWLVEVRDSRRFTDVSSQEARSGATCVVDVRFREAVGDPYEERG